VGGACGLDLLSALAPMPRILMLYNADAGLANGALDSLHKLFSPGTYACRLCQLTYGLARMKTGWRQTIEGLPHPVAFLHRDEWQAAHPGDSTPLPAILLETAGSLETLISAAEFEGIESLDALQALLADRLPASAA
jgi:hypothetical protein